MQLMKMNSNALLKTLKQFYELEKARPTLSELFGKRDLVSDRIANEISFSGNEMKRDLKRLV